MHCLVASTGRVRRDSTQKRMQRGLALVVVQKLNVTSSSLLRQTGIIAAVVFVVEHLIILNPIDVNPLRLRMLLGIATSILLG